jgi:UDP-N-acetylbacillosamine N-acetyltransferase
MSASPLYIHGIGGQASVIFDAIQFQDEWEAVFISDHPEIAKIDAPPSCIISTQQWKAIPKLVRTEDGGFLNCNTIVAIGNNETRERISKQLADEEECLLTTIIHPATSISEAADIDDGVFIGAAAVINPYAAASEGAIINTAAVIEHHCIVGAYAHIAPNATLLGEVTVGERTLIGAGAIVLPGIQIGDDCVVGAGSVVTKNVATGNTVVGNPARIIQHSRKQFTPDELKQIEELELQPDEQRDHMTGDGTILA